MKLRRSLLLYLALGVIPGSADIQNYYFYWCDSGVVDCSTFQHHDYGGYGIFSSPPIIAGTKLPLTDYQSYSVLASNNRGEVLLRIQEFIGTQGGYGVNGQMYALGCCGSEFVAGDINNNGVYAWSGGNPGYTFYIGSGPQPFQVPTIEIQNGPGPDPLDFGVVVAINESDQVLENLYEGPDHNLRQGVFSPFPVGVPEPAGLTLLATLVGFAVLLPIFRGLCPGRTMSQYRSRPR